MKFVNCLQAAAVEKVEIRPRNFKVVNFEFRIVNKFFIL